MLEINRGSAPGSVGVYSRSGGYYYFTAAEAEVFMNKARDTELTEELVPAPEWATMALRFVFEKGKMPAVFRHADSKPIRFSKADIEKFIVAHLM
jgi:hypothetical protein